jgi:Rnl2 family RNA ligase
MPFIKFESIKNVRHVIKTVNCKLNKNKKWYASEKLHGANFQIIYDQNGVSFASRNHLLQQNGHNEDSFFDFSHIKDKLTNNIISLAKNLNAKNINVYGELYGGNIQQEIKYDDFIAFRVFDVVVDSSWLPYDKFEKELSMFDLITPLVCDTLNICLEHKVEFTSNYSTSNAEGFVVKFISPDGKTRITMKNKAPSFIEKHSGKITKIRQYKITSTETISDHPELASYILNNNRFTSWYSKTGPQQLKNINNDAKEIIMDAIKDYMSVACKNVSEKNIQKIAFSFFQELACMLKMRFNENA